MSSESSRQTAPRVFDRGTVWARLARAHRAGREHVLLDRAIEDLTDRLAPVQREFRHVLDCASPRPAVAAALGVALPGAEVTRIAPWAEPCAVSPAILRAVADEEALPFGPERFDLAVSLLSLHAVNDLPGTLVQLRRVLKPDGLLLGCLLGGQTLHELRGVFTAAELEVTGHASPRVAPFADLRDLGGLLQRAGFALPVTDTDVVRMRFDSLFGLMAELRAMGVTNALADRSRQSTRKAVMLRAAQLYAERFSDPDGRVRATFELVWLSGWSPHENQQKPMQPGSAKMRLADALAAMRHEDLPKGDDS